MNKVMMIGHVGTDPEVRYVEQGVAVARFRFATRTIKIHPLMPFVANNLLPV